MFAFKIHYQQNIKSQQETNKWSWLLLYQSTGKRGKHCKIFTHSSDNLVWRWKEMKYLYLNGSNCSACSPVLFYIFISGLEHALTDNPQSRKPFLNKILKLHSLLQSVAVDFTESQNHKLVEVNLTWLTWHLCFFIEVKALWKFFSFHVSIEKFFFRDKTELIPIWDIQTVLKMSVLLNVLIPWKGERRVPGLPSGGESVHEQQVEKFVCLYINPFLFSSPRLLLHLPQKGRDQTTSYS